VCEAGSRGERGHRRGSGQGRVFETGGVDELEVHVVWNGVCVMCGYLECLEDLLSAAVPEGVERRGAQRRPCHIAQAQRKGERRHDVSI
jgi:hypothetical protein